MTHTPTHKDFTDEQLSRYARHIVLPELGGVGQGKLMDASVLVIGAGGLGSPLLLYLAAAGVNSMVAPSSISILRRSSDMLSGMQRISL